MPSYEEIYERHAAEYDELVDHEDYQGNLINTLLELVDFREKSVMEFGAGTGRLTKLLLPFVKEIHAFDQSPHMIARAEQNLSHTSYRNYTLNTGSHVLTSAPSSEYDIAIEGWSFGHCILANPESWEDVAGELLGEMNRVVRRTGTLIIIETLGTGFEQPQVPDNALGMYYRYLEATAGFQKKSVRTDYQFPSVAEASRILGFFFGERMKAFVAQHKQAIIPECTGIWYRQS